MINDSSPQKNARPGKSRQGNGGNGETARRDKPENILSIIDKHRKDRGSLIAILEDIQARYGYLPETALRIVASNTGQSLVDIYGIATFYSAFTLKPRGKHHCVACQGTACHVRGATEILEELQHKLKIAPGETTKDGEFTLETANCLGACALGPIVVVDGHYFPNVRRSRVSHVLEEGKKAREPAQEVADQRIFPIEVACPYCSHTLMDTDNPVDGYPAIRVRVSVGHAQGWLLLSSLFGSFTIKSEYPIPAGTVVGFICPHCQEDLIHSSFCPECDGRMALMNIVSGGTAQICTRRGCAGHELDIGGLHY